MNFVNINTQETNLPNKIGSMENITWENSKQLLKDAGWRIKPDLPPIAEGFERLSVNYIDGYEDTATAIYTDTLIQDRLDAEEAEMQLNKSDDLKHAENEFITFCDTVTDTTNHVKLSIPQLEAIGANITDELTAVKLELALLKINAKCVLYGGVNWWDSCVWHPEIIGV